MGILSRLLRLFKADVHGVMDQLEDKGLLLKQCLREMEIGLEEKETRLARMTRVRRQIAGDLTRHREDVQKLETDLDLAVRKDKDDIARVLIRKRRSIQGSCEQLVSQLENLTKEKDQLSEILSGQRLQYDQLKIKAAAFCQRSEQHDFEETMDAVDVSCGWKTPTDAEIEIELLQRKEARQPGGAS